MLTIRISSALANEYVGRDMFRFAQRCGTITVTLAQAHELLEDARFNADAAYGPEEMPPGVRLAYRSLAATLDATIARFSPFQPPAFEQAETTRGEPRCHYLELRPEFPGDEPCLGDIVPDEREVKSIPAVRRQVRNFNDTIGFFAALQLNGVQARGISGR